MNRRDFLGGAAAGLTVPRFLGSSQPALTPLPDPEPGVALPRALWLANGLIDVGGTHEPYIFVIRRGGQSLGARAFQDEQQSESLIRRLQKQGAEVFHTHLYKGFGMAAEREEMEDTKRVAEIVHRYGMRLDSYIQWNSLMYETFFAEEPRAKDWIQRDINGLPILLTYGYQQSYRYRPCFSHQPYLDYLKKVVRYAVVEVKTDFIHFDNFGLNPEPESCHCAACVQGFRTFLRTKYSPEMRRERFGFENTDFVNPPQWNLSNPPEKLQIIFDPAIQEWIDFRCQLMADALKQIALYAKSLNREVVIEVNPHGITGGNRAWEAGIDHTRILKWTEAFVTEEENPPGFMADGRLISKVRSYKLARAFRNILMTPISDDPVATAESLAFDQTVGSYMGQDPQPSWLLDYVVFYRKYRDLYIGAEDIANVAVLRSYPSITYHNARAQLSAILVEQTLIQSRIPFKLVFDEHLVDLTGIDVVILPDSECLSDKQLGLIRDFVSRGGGLVVIGGSGLYDEWRRARVQPGLQGLVIGQESGSAYEESVETLGRVTGEPTRKQVAKGRVIYFPGVPFDGILPSPEPHFSISNRYWRLPKNWQELREGIHWAAKGFLPAKIGGPAYLVANLTAQPDKRRTMIHLVNYDAKNSPSIKAIEIACSLPSGASAKEVSVYSPDASAPNSLIARGDAGQAEFVLPELQVYAVVAVSW